MTEPGLIAEYLIHLENLDRGENTREHYEDVLTRMDRQLPAGLTSACTEELQAWINEGGRKPVTRQHYRAIAHGFFEWATDPRDQRLDFNPVALVPQVRVHRRRPRPITNDELKSIIGRAAAPFRLWYLIGAYAGLRCIELATLERSHITEREIWICGKGEEERIVDTHPLVWAAVRDLKGHIVRRLDGQPATRQYVSARGNHHLQYVLGVDHTMHHLRRWFGTAAYESSGKDIRVTQELLGHKQVNTTQIYVDIAAGGKAAAVAALPFLG